MIWVSESEWTEEADTIVLRNNGDRFGSDRRAAFLDVARLPVPVSIAKRRAKRLAGNRIENLIIAGLVFVNGLTGFALAAIAASIV